MYNFFICTRSISHLKCGVYVYENALMLDMLEMSAFVKLHLNAKDKAYFSKKIQKQM